VASTLMPARQPILPPTYLLGSLVLMVLLWKFLPGPHLIVFPWNLVGPLPTFMGVTFNVVGDRQFHRAKTTMNPFGQPHEVVTTGVFRCSRHPMYLGLVLIVLGTATLLGYATPFAPSANAVDGAPLSLRSTRRAYDVRTVRRSVRSLRESRTPSMDLKRLTLASHRYDHRSGNLAGWFEARGTGFSDQGSDGSRSSSRPCDGLRGRTSTNIA
jgi:hypothetical protein